ncbi:uncharacterized protein [Aegilops tauschii subsp. strangulata]|uniref:uncharacterized protein isoform X1 n=1 Tax=Aegilops tauschii subsp. strangulata TaxID=200361 RepID=UPI003CC8CAA0
MAAARSAPSSRSTRHWLRGLASDADICCGATPTRSTTTACRFRTPSDGCTATVPRSMLCSRQVRPCSAPASIGDNKKAWKTEHCRALKIKLTERNKDGHVLTYSWISFTSTSQERSTPF